jgi:hypothetical protein
VISFDLVHRSQGQAHSGGSGPGLGDVGPTFGVVKEKGAHFLWKKASIFWEKKRPFFLGSDSFFFWEATAFFSGKRQLFFLGSDNFFFSEQNFQICFIFVYFC